MKISPHFILLFLLLISCRNQPKPWNGPVMTEPRRSLTVEELTDGKAQPLLDMSHFARPAWAVDAKAPFSGTVMLEESTLNFQKEKEYYPGEDLFPALQLDLLSVDGKLLPANRQRISTREEGRSYWDVIAGTGRIWHETEDGDWDRASFPLTLTDRWVGQARNCVATFVYRRDSISNICLQCSQETADIDDRQLGDIYGIIPAKFTARHFADSAVIAARHFKTENKRLTVRPLSEFDVNQELAGYFEKSGVTRAPTSIGAVIWDSTLYLHPPGTRHGAYPYPEEMRHGLYSVTKSMTGALALLYFEERYPEDLFGQPVSKYVPALAGQAGWEGVTFEHTLNMVTGTAGGEGPDQLFNTLIAPETAEEAIANIARLGDAPGAPGETFNYASTNLFVLSCALQNYVAEKEGRPVRYWDLVRENVLEPIGAGDFTLLHTMEQADSLAIPILAYGALPTIDEAAEIAMLFANGGSHEGRQILDRRRVLEIFDAGEGQGSNTNNDYRGTGYRHGFWSKEVKTDKCTVRATFMLGFGENYIVFLPSNAIVFRFMDEHDLDISPLIRRVEKLRSSCPQGK